MVDRIMIRRALIAAVLAAACGGAPDPALAQPATGAPADLEALAAEYRGWLDRGRTPARVVELVRSGSPGFTEIDLQTAAPAASPGDRLLFVDRDRTVMVVIVGREPVRTAGLRIIGAHIDTPSPRLAAVTLTRAGQATLELDRYGGMRNHHWPGRPVALVGRVATAGGAKVEISLGEGDDFALWVEERAGELVLRTGSMPDDDDAAPSLVEVLHQRHGLTAADLEATELYVVPREPAREVGLDRRLLGAHGQDDRVNSYAAWRALVDLEAAPERTAVVWLVDREEIGSTGPTGARSRFLELAVAWLLRASGEPATESALLSALAATQVLSADTPACLNPNWAEVHEESHAPVLGGGPALFPFTGSRGKQGGSAAHPELVAEVIDLFAAIGQPIQYGELGRVDEGGGGTIAKYLAARGADVVDLGVCVVSMHSPFEITDKGDVWAAYRGFHAWLKGAGR
jgi:aspartyl aminopeptidase